MNIQEEVPVLPPPTREKSVSRSGWKHVLWAGLTFYLAGLAILLLTGNPNLFPTVMMLGNFLIPIVYVTFLFERRRFSNLTAPATASAFIYGGILGVFAASLLEPIFIRQLDVAAFLNIGLIEEFAKILGVWAIARHRSHDAEMDGLIMGAAVGMGFASLESNGYAFVSFLESGGSLSATVWVTLLRGVLSPVGHGAWTAILASVLFRESQAGRFILNERVIGTYLLVSMLHGLWDGLPLALSSWDLSPLRTSPIFRSGVALLLAQTAVGGIGLLILRRRWKEALFLQMMGSPRKEG